MEHLRAQLLLEPRPTSLALDFLNLQDVSLLLPSLEHLPLRELKLNGNALSRLPSNLSGLRSLRRLDIAQNPFRSVPSLAAALETLPSLEHLWVTLSRDGEAYLLDRLPCLHSLNGKLVNMTATGAAEGRPAGASPPRFDGLKRATAKLFEENGSGDSFREPAAKPGGVDTGLLGADDLHLDSSNCLEGANSLESSAELASKQESVSARVLSTDDFEVAAHLYGSIAGLRSVKAPEMGDDPREDALRLKFDERMKRIAAALERRQAASESDTERAADALVAKHEVFDVCSGECIVVAEACNAGLADIMRTLRSVQASLFGDFRGLIFEERRRWVEEQALARTKLRRAKAEGMALLEAAEALARDKEAAERRIAYLENQLRQLRQSKEPPKSEGERFRGRSRQFGEEATPRTREVEASPSWGVDQERRNGRREEGPRWKEGSKSLSPKEEKLLLSATRAPVMSNPCPEDSQMLPGEIRRHEIHDESQASGEGSRSVRSRSLQQLKGLIGAIYASKSKSDARRRSAGQAYETMEQHFFTFLTQRYGLKALIDENASAILRAMQRYASFDNHVAVFAKIMRNEIEEGFRCVQDELLSAAAHLLRQQLQVRNPLAREEELAATVERQLRSEEPVDERDWRVIVSSIFDDHDCRSIYLALQQIIRRYPSANVDPRSLGQGHEAERSGDYCERPGSTGVLFFDQLSKVLLDYQLHRHEKFLAPFRRTFRRFDADLDGVIDRAGFKALLTTVFETLPASQLDVLLLQVDPHQQDVVTFSKTVAAFGSDVLSLFAARSERISMGKKKN